MHTVPLLCITVDNDVKLLYLAIQHHSIIVPSKTNDIDTTTTKVVSISLVKPII